mgnify:CR=1 FL=1
MQAGLRLSESAEAESISAGEVNALRITDGSTQSVFCYKSVTCFTKSRINKKICEILYKVVDERYPQW